MKPRSNLALALIMLLSATTVSATDLTVNFTATIKETTCAIKVSAIGGANLSGNSAANDYYLDFPTMGVSDISNKSALTEASFKLTPTDCNNEIASIVMTIGGASTADSSRLLTNDNTSSGDASHIGVGFRRMDEDDTQRFTLDGTTHTNWTRDEIINGLQLTGVIRQTTTASDITPGAFQAKATFVFTYN